MMKLFLSSQDFGNFAEDLREMVGENRKTLVIANARDYEKPEVREDVVKRKLKMFRDAGFEPVELDLREFFSKDPTELVEVVASHNPGLIFTLGGSTFLLATALAVSGMDVIIRRLLERNMIVYGGYSAGAMVAAREVENYERDDLRVEEIEGYYGAPAVTSGLGLIAEYIIPHADQPRFDEDTKFFKKHLGELGVDTVVLDDGDVYIVNGSHKIIKKA